MSSHSNRMLEAVAAAEITAINLIEARINLASAKDKLKAQIAGLEAVERCWPNIDTRTAVVMLTNILEDY